MPQFDYTSLSEQFETYLAAHQPYGVPDSLYEPIRYINDLGGKRIRPVLVLMAYNLFHEDVTPALPAALAVEYFHNFSLMHDDIMDEAPLRRGKETVHNRFGLNNAILSGDAMLIRCFDLLLEAGKLNNIGAELCSVMCKAAMQICEGQQMDMDFETKNTPSEQAYLEMIRLKTACLIGVSLQIGAMLAGADAFVANKLSQFGEKVGMSFQVHDDILDLYGDESKTGKQKGGDILQGKKNYLFVYTWNVLAPQKQKFFEQAYGIAGKSKDIRAVMNVYEQLNAEAAARRLKNELWEGAMVSLKELEKLDISLLESFSSFLMSRQQ